MTLRSTLALALATASAGASVTRAEGLIQDVFAPTVSLRSAYFERTRARDGERNVVVPSVWLRLEPKLGIGEGREPLSFRIEGWAREENLFRDSSTDELKGDLREAYADLTLGRLDVRVGRQINLWGRADAINPTDSLATRDFTALTAEESDQRSGVLSTRVAYNFGGQGAIRSGSSARLIGIGQQEFRPNRIPLPQLSGIRFIQQPRQDAWNQWALKYEETGGVVDASISYFDGYDRFPDIGIGSVRAPGDVDLALRYHRLRVLGADAAWTLGSFGFRAEAAQTWTEDGRGDRPDVKNPFLFVVLGVDRTFLENLNVNVQYAARRIERWRAPTDIADPSAAFVGLQQQLASNQLDPWQNGLSTRISKKWWNETLETEIAGLIWLKRRDFIARPKVTYAISDHYKATLGADFFRGPVQSAFGFLRGASTAFIEFRGDW